MWPPNDPEQREYVSVTTALNALPKDALKYWAAKVTAETAVEKYDLLGSLIADDPTTAVDWLKRAPFAKRDRAADIGTSVHEVVELDAAGETNAADEVIASLPAEGKNKVRQARAFFRDVDLTIEHIEFVTYHHSLGYAGTGDFIATFNDWGWALPGIETTTPSMIVDLKTGNAVYGEAALQMSAYRYAENLVDLRTGEMRDMPSVDGAAVLHVTEDGWSLIPVDTSDYVFDQFKAALMLSKHVPLDPKLVGTPILRGKA